MSSNEAASTEPLPAYAFGPWLDVKEGENPFLVGADYENKKWPGHVFFNSIMPFGNPAAIRRAYRIGEWHPHDGGPCPIEPQQMTEVDYELGAQITAWPAEVRHWPTVKRFRPLARQAVAEPEGEARAIIRDLVGAIDPCGLQDGAFCAYDRARAFLGEN